MKNIVVPEAMIKVVDEAIGKARIEQAHRLSDRNGELYPNNFERITLETALGWLYDKLGSLEHKPYDDLLAHEYNACLADVRRMFRAPDDESPEDGTVEFLSGTTRPVAVWWQGNRHRVVTFADPEVEQEDYADRILKNASSGYTPTHAELDKIWEHIFRAGHGWVPPEMRGGSKVAR